LHTIYRALRTLVGGWRPRTRRYRWVLSPCYVSAVCDHTIHVILPRRLRTCALRMPRPLRGRLIAWARFLEQTSPRWGWLTAWRDAYKIEARPWAMSDGEGHPA
jgi:hypothetical protein